MALHIINVAKRLSQHLELLRLRATHRGKLYIAACAAERVKSTVFPRTVRRSRQSSPLYVACATGTRIRTLVYPRGV